MFGYLDVLGIREGSLKCRNVPILPSQTKRPKVLELTTQVVQQSDTDAKLYRRVALLEGQIKARVCNDNKIDALEARITSHINAAVSVAVLAATAQYTMDSVVSLLKVPKKTVTIAPITACLYYPSSRDKKRFCGTNHPLCLKGCLSTDRFLILTQEYD